jgi:hypothetical protein
MEYLLGDGVMTFFFEISILFPYPNEADRFYFNSGKL